MNGHSRFTLGFVIILALLAVYLGCELVSFAAAPSGTVQLVVSRPRVRPGQTVEFGLKLTDSQGRSKPFPRSSRPPQLVLTDSQGQTLGKYTFSFG